MEPAGRQRAESGVTMAKGKWKVMSQYIGSEKMYIVGRQLDESKQLHSGNVEYHGGYTNYKEKAQATADFLNEAEEQKAV